MPSKTKCPNMEKAVRSFIVMIQEIDSSGHSSALVSSEVVEVNEITQPILG